MTQQSKQQTSERLDLYTGVHKGLRGLMADTLIAVGKLDSENSAQFTHTVGRVAELLLFCRLHLEKENAFVHPAIEARRPGGSQAIADDHVHHVESLSALEADLQALERSAESARPRAAAALYRRLALFVAENFVHMHAEEAEHNALLWELYSDEELLALQRALVGSIPPPQKVMFLRWMVPCMTPPERLALLSEIRETAPPQAFTALLEAMRAHLSESEWSRLLAGLAPLGLAA
jgi:hypothetical protein